MTKQHFEVVADEIRQTFRERGKQVAPSSIKISWSSWNFGLELLAQQSARLKKYGVKWVEFFCNKYGPDLGYKPQQILPVLNDYGIKVAGVLSMSTPDFELASNRGNVRQAAIDYFKHCLEFAHDVGAKYMIVMPSAVGRPQKIDAYEFDRSVETLQKVADEFTKAGVAGAIEPIRSAEVSFCHSLRDAKEYIQAVNHPGICKINADIYHMINEEPNPYQSLVEYGGDLCNLHLADTNRFPIGQGFLDVDLLLMALAISKFDFNESFLTGEPLGPGGDPIPLMFGKPLAAQSDKLVEATMNTLNERIKTVFA